MLVHCLQSIQQQLWPYCRYTKSVGLLVDPYFQIFFCLHISYKENVYVIYDQHVKLYSWISQHPAISFWKGHTFSWPLYFLAELYFWSTYATISFNKKSNYILVIQIPGHKISW